MEEMFINDIIFSRIKDFPNYYISKCGKVYSIKKSIFLESYVNTNGYERVSLGRKNRFYIHQLLAKTFILNPENKRCINHKNGIKTDNRLENLEWNTYSENNKHKFRVLKQKNSKSLLGFYNYKNPSSKQFIYKNKLYGSFKELRDKFKLTDYKLNKLRKEFKFISREEYLKRINITFKFKGKAHKSKVEDL